MAVHITRREFLGGAAATVAGVGLGLADIDVADARNRPYRAFKHTSYWNKPIPSSVPVDPRSHHWIRWLAHHNPDPDVLVGGHSGWAHPFYFSTESDPLVTMSATRFTTNLRVTFRLPGDAVPSTGPDHEMSVVDRTTNQDVHLFRFSRLANGTPTCEGMARYWLDSKGIAEASGGTDGNAGHRGIPGFEHGFLEAEIRAGAIHRRMKFSIPQTGPRHFWPMYTDQDHDGVIPEGVVMRIKPGVRLRGRVSGGSLVVARACKKYGIMVGDSSGLRTTLKGQMGVDWTQYGMPTDYHALKAFPIHRDWEFMHAGWRP